MAASNGINNSPATAVKPISFSPEEYARAQAVVNSKKYISNRSATYNPFNSNIQASPAATSQTPTVIVQEPAYQQPVLHNFEPQVPPKRGLGCSPFAVVSGFFKGLWTSLMLIRNTIMTAFMLLILALLAVILILVYKPPFFWNPIKTFLNDGINKPVVTATTVDLDTVYNKISTTALANKPVVLTDNELTEIIRANTFLQNKCFVTTKPEGMRFYINIDTEERPLWFITETRINTENRIVVSNAGFGRFNTPQGVATFLNDTLGLVFKFIENQVTADSSVAAFKQIINPEKLDSNLDLKQVEFKDGSVVLSYQNNSPKTVFGY